MQQGGARGAWCLFGWSGVCIGNLALAQLGAQEGPGVCTGGLVSVQVAWGA